MTDTPSGAPPAPSRPTPGDIQDAEKVLRTMQRILANMGSDGRCQSPEFQQIMAMYKHLGANLHQVRKTVQAEAAPAVIVQPRPRQAPVTPTALGAARRVPVVPLAPPSVSAIARARQAYGRTAAAAPPASPAPTRPAAAAQPAIPAAAPPVAAAQPSPALSAPPAAQPVPAPVTETALPAAPEQAGALPAGFPLAMPKFVSTLGPAGSRAINRGPEVQRLQQLLARLGYDVPQADTFDVKIFRAVQEFQKVHRIQVNGLVGVEMRRLLNELVTG